MDQLLHCGMGFPNGYNDGDRRPSMKSGFSMLMYFAFGIILGVCAFLFVTSLVSCSSSRHAVSVSHSVRDSSLVVVRDTAAKVSVSQVSVSAVSSDTTHSVLSVTEKADNTETITEHIVEFTDSSGNRTVTTDRSTSRALSSSRQTNSEEWQRHREEQLAVMLSRLDSIASSIHSSSSVHSASNDSTINEVHKNPSRGSSVFRSLELSLVIAALLAALIFFLPKVYNKVRNGN